MTIPYMAFIKLLWLVASVSAGSASPEICLSHATGFAHVSADGCGYESSPYREASANIFNLLWNVWSPSP